MNNNTMIEELLTMLYNLGISQETIINELLKSGYDKNQIYDILGII